MCAYVHVCVRACLFECVVCVCVLLDKEWNWMFFSIALVLVSLTMWLTGYRDYLTSFYEPLPAPYECHTSVKTMQHHHWPRCPDWQYVTVAGCAGACKGVLVGTDSHSLSCFCGHFQVSQPIYSTLMRWIYDGELEDTYHEVSRAVPGFSIP